MKIAVSFLSCLAVGIVAAGCGSGGGGSGSGRSTVSGVSSQTGPGNQTGGTSTPSLAGSYLGTYTSTSGLADHGRVGLIVYPDLSFTAIAVSEVDETVRETCQGSLTASGQIQTSVTYEGTVFTLDMTRLEGTYLGQLSEGAFSLHRAAGDPVVGCYVGSTTNVTLGIAGQWMAIVDEQRRLFAVYFYPAPFPYLSEGVQGTVVSDGAGGYALQAGNSSNTINGQGTLLNGWVNGTWDSPSQGQHGTWTGAIAPR